MTDKLPSFLNAFVEAQAYLDKECGDDDLPSATKLREILEAAWGMAEATPLYRTDGGECGFCGSDRSDDPDPGCDPACPHRRLKEALSDE